ncbi:hypothetical protein APA386B_1P48 (plasmid) [Acetobacter pasteurianus 386B]|nr:hypothetical protein APA386B_1P48 [Acetobacter pasteurianus 386B]
MAALPQEKHYQRLISVLFVFRAADQSDARSTCEKLISAFRRSIMFRLARYVHLAAWCKGKRFDGPARAG